MDKELKCAVQVPEATALANIIKDNFTPQVKTIATVNGREVQVLIAPEGMEAHSLQAIIDQHLPVPPRRKGTVKIVNLESFITITQRFKDVNSVLFANPSLDKASLLAIFNYDKDGGDQITGLDGVGVARHNDHRALYELPFSDEWKIWLKGNGQVMKQNEFAAFIEDRLGDIDMPDANMVGDITDAATGGDFGSRTPAEQLALLAKLLGGTFAVPAQLVELSRGLQVYENSTTANAVNLSTGEGSVQFINKQGDAEGKPVKVPNLFLIAIPIWLHGKLYRIAVRLRYRVASPSIVWFYQLYRHEYVFDAAFKEAAETARDETELPLYYGQPS